MTIGWLNVQSLTNKIDAVNSTITDRSLDVLALTETGHSGCDDVRLRLATPAGYAVADVARTTGRGGGVAIIYRQHFQSSRVPLPPCATFEAVCVRLTLSSGPVVLVNIYRPGSVRPSTAFFNELSSVLEVLVAFSCPVIVGGDINIHVDDDSDSHARRLHELLASFDMTQHVAAPTHRCGHRLDLDLQAGRRQCRPSRRAVRSRARRVPHTSGSGCCAVNRATSEGVETSRPQRSETGDRGQRVMSTGT